MSNFTVDDVKLVENASSLESAKDFMIKIINKAHPDNSIKTMNPRKIAFLKELQPEQRLIKLQQLVII
jgi:hypothetical protein